MQDRQSTTTTFRGIGDYCANLHLGIQDGQRAQTQDQTNNTIQYNIALFLDEPTLE